MFAQVKPIEEHSEFVNYDQALSSKNMASIDSVLPRAINLDHGGAVDAMHPTW